MIKIIKKFENGLQLNSTSSLFYSSSVNIHLIFNRNQHITRSDQLDLHVFSDFISKLPSQTQFLETNHELLQESRQCGRLVRFPVRLAVLLVNLGIERLVGWNGLDKEPFQGNLFKIQRNCKSTGKYLCYHKFLKRGV